MPTDIAPDTTHSEEDSQSHCSLLFRPSRADEASSRGERVCWVTVGPQAKGPESTGYGGGSEEDGQSHCSLSFSVPREPTRPSRGERVWGLIRVSVRVTRLLLAVYVLVWLHERRLWEIISESLPWSREFIGFTEEAQDVLETSQADA